MIERKAWAKYTPAEIETMKTAVMYADDETPFSPEYAAAYLGVSSSTLQYWRCHRTDAVIYSKAAGAVIYLKKDLKEYLDRHRRRSTTTAA